MTKFTEPSISDFRDAHAGQPAWILSSGPSIRSHDLSKIQNGIRFYVNGAARLIDGQSEDARYFVTSDERFLTDEKNRELASEKLPPDMFRLIRDKCRPIDVHTEARRTLYVASLERSGFSKNLLVGYYFGCTSTMLAVHFAYWAGCDPIILLGTDLTYAFENKRFYEEENPQPVDKLLNVQLWNIANAARVLREESRTMIYCSPKSLIRPYVDYMPFDEAVEAYSTKPAAAELSGAKTEG